ncbi:hypothetical protein BVG16_23450 [Paenibacillus selenitireducens]|uniref:DUF4097 domain-containing protein n=1 Tax=Paenibacillus selenitireducens TaxID=1324314 RepID=A0A1T2X560_9BACL|nr:DUF4097 family beta strand repeat-containing protein [Paenibacillus selenitireducens]OPA74713.1 hypothetical protein BVG16_23450 [Paenibacillus selenitireducens]
MRKSGVIFIATCCIIVGIIGLIMYGVEDPKNKMVDYTKKWSIDAAGLKNLKITTDFNMDVEFIESTDQSNYIELTGKLPEDVIQHLDSLQPNAGSFDLSLQYSRSFQLFSFDFPKDQKVVVALAKDAKLQSIESDSGSSNISFEGVHAEKINFVASSGNIDVEHIQGAHIQIEGNSGNISGKGIEGDLQTKLTSGNIKLQDVKGDLQAHATSGNIKVNNHEGAASIRASSGNVELEQRTISPLDVSAESGNVRIFVPETFDGFYDVQTGSGDMSVPESKLTTKDVIKARTSSGNVKITKE